MRIAFFTNEYPPNVYGGAGVHVEYLSRELARAGRRRAPGGRLQLRRAARGPTATCASGVAPDASPAQDPRHARLLDALVRDLAMVGRGGGAGHRALPHLVLAPGRLPRAAADRRAAGADHALAGAAPAVEGGAARHRLQRHDWIERTAYQNADGVIAVSGAMKEDVQALYGVPPERVRVIHNGIDPDEYRPRP
jgi:alpha-maltose-1-phosphate synthase